MRPILLALGLVVLACAQQAELQPVKAALMPGIADSNSPAVWHRGKFILFNSDGMPVRTEGEDQFSLGLARAVKFYDYSGQPYWIESAWVDDDGTMYAWYHHEPFGVCAETNLTTPQIGALVSYDAGLTFYSLGLTLTSGDPPDCSAGNGYFAGGHGDFTVLLDSTRSYFYFYFSNYGGPESSQGIAVARMAFVDRNNPVGAVWKYHEGDWTEPGLEGAVTSMLPPRTGWSSGAADAFWGPSLHWNTYLGKYVMLLNHSCCAPGWPQEGIYISYSGDLANPEGWTAPSKLLEAGGWYPQVLGLDPGDTDKQAGRVARFYMGSDSHFEIVFHK